MKELCLGVALGLAVSLTAGCAHAPRPVPPRDQLAASVVSAGVRLTVPRLEYRSYPDHVLDAATAVFVVIENDSDVELAITSTDFSLGPANGLRQAPLAPRQILVSRQPPGATEPSPPVAPRPTLLAGPVMEARAVAGSLPPPAAGGGVRIGPPPPAVGVHPPAAAGRFYGSRGYGGGPWGWGWGADPYYWSWGPYWGVPYEWNMLYYAPHPRQSIIRVALQDGVLAAGGRAAGFLYFPQIQGAQRGMPVTLHWEVHDAATHNLRTRIELPLELDNAQ